MVTLDPIVVLFAVATMNSLGKLCTTKTKHLKFSKSQTGSDVSVQLAS
jgi:hypothetical protein